MDIVDNFRAVAAILKESIKRLPRNGKFLALIALLSALLYSSLYLVFNFSTMYLLSDMLLKQYSLYPSSGSSSSAIANTLDSIMKDFRLLLLIDVSFLFGMFFVSWFTAITTVILSAASYSSQTLSGKDLVLRVVKSWIRPFITLFYLTLLAVGYFSIVILVACPLLMFSGTYMLPTAIVVGVAAYTFYLYLNVVWVLALVVSVMEENNYGIQALGKAGVLIKGKRLQGLILSISLSLLSLILSLGFKIIVGQKVTANQTVLWIYVSILSCLVKILLLTAYTVLYIHCRKDQGEEMELQGSVSYKKLSTEPPFTDAA